MMSDNDKVRRWVTDQHSLGRCVGHSHDRKWRRHAVAANLKNEPSQNDTVIVRDELL